MGIEGKKEWGLSLLLVLLLCPLTLFLRPERQETEGEASDPRRDSSVLSSASPPALEAPTARPAGVEIEGWEIDAVELYAPEKLHEKIDGRAGLYLSYDARELRYTLYKGPGDREAEVYHYTMASPIDAFGIFTEERPAGAASAGVGDYAYSDGGMVAYCEGGSYVIVLPVLPPEGPVLDLAKAYAQEHASEDALAVHAMVPEKNRTEGSFAYKKGSPFGIDPLPPVFTAEYDLEGTVFQAVLARTKESDRELLPRLQSFFDRIGTVRTEDTPQGPLLQAEAFDLGFLFLFLPERLLGAVEVEGKTEAAREFLLEWARETGRDA